MLGSPCARSYSPSSVSSSRPKITRDGAHKSVVEYAAGEFLPLFVFEGFQEARADARGRGEFLQRNFAHLALTLQAFAKISPGHESKPVLADTCGAAARSNIAAIANQPVAASALFSALIIRMTST